LSRLKTCPFCSIADRRMLSKSVPIIFIRKEFTIRFLSNFCLTKPVTIVNWSYWNASVLAKLDIPNTCFKIKAFDWLLYISYVPNAHTLIVAARYEHISKKRMFFYEGHSGSVLLRLPENFTLIRASNVMCLKTTVIRAT